jgi:hypothetical protein
MNLRFYKIAGALATIIIFVASSVSVSMADDGQVTAKWQTSDGEALSNAPVVVRGRTVQGDEFSTFTLTDIDGNLQVYDLPEGEYEAIPAWADESAVRFSIARQRSWYQFWAEPEIVDLGEITVGVESFELPESAAARE